MGDPSMLSTRWAPPMAPRALPLGKGNIYPLGEPHAVSVSLPTWDSVVGLSRKEQWVMEKLEWSYPRFVIVKPVDQLTKAVLKRLEIDESATRCMMFSSKDAARKCIVSLKASPTYSEHLSVEIVRFCMPAESNLRKSPVHWANFSAVLLSPELWKDAMAFWRDSGAGLSSRHAEFCLEELGYLDSDSSNPKLRSPAPRKRSHRQIPPSLMRVQAAATSLDQLKVFIGELATSDQPNQPNVSMDDVFVYPNGMNAIYSLSESLSSLNANSTVAAYGWLYPETVEVLRHGPWSFLSYKYGTDAELDQLERLIQSGEQVHALFCELPSNILLSSVDLPKIRALADKYGMMVVCDDTVAGYVNLDALPYVDVMVTSLTKTFSGTSNVTGGSVVLNPRSRYHDAIQATLLANYENAYFPFDCSALRDNCQDIVWRVQKCCENTLPLVELLSSHPSIATVHHPTTSPTLANYQKVMRQNGSYGNVFSIVFHDPHAAEHFYNTLDVCKGSSFGANFTIVIPYVQLANYWNREKVPKYGVPQHILRVSVGLEDKNELLSTFQRALKGVEALKPKSHCKDE
ncbi:pyridoxal phosphate-dependent transferase [Aspergillus bertholletiae]|uniref:Pyridoxal phosphate-dependent transferase n=1 Tax=Aspergillus bertholletiae TaxID=1226010 RepID=A0A5N7BB48_9EURO|nr:pyridoxal phosphate-dependent transferase [Aspergillus bertholletiae]